LDLGDNKITGLPSPLFSAVDKKGRHFVVCYALGHLYGLVDIKGNRSIYPVFDVRWMPILKQSSKTRSSILSTKIEKIIKTISILSQNATGFIHACDYDQEGEVIGYNILEHACNGKYEKSMRAKFSTLTDDEIRGSFDNLLKSSKRLADAGRSRHMIDFVYGVNLSRALTQSFKVGSGNKRYYNLSIGRVQGPTLAFVVDKEIEIRSHIPVPYWTVAAEFKKNGQSVKAYYFPQRIDSLSKANLIVDACRNQNGNVTEVKTQDIEIKAPNPFDLGDLQKEAYRTFKFSPSYTLAIAEKLYLSALISYPRTSSQKLPPSINFKKIISELSKINSHFSPAAADNNKGREKNEDSYADMAIKLLSQNSLSPNEGNKTDPAHPAIYPTGEKPKGKLESAELKLFDLIIKRFFATFGEPAISQQTTLTIIVKNNHIFKAKGKRLLCEGWMCFYKPYVYTYMVGTSIALPVLCKSDILKCVEMTLTEKFTQPPFRFNESSLLEEMEKEKIGTKSTRSEIINTLFRRNYITNSVGTFKKEDTNEVVSRTGIEPTDLGFTIIQSLRKYVPNIVSTDLTRSMEEHLEEIELGKAKSEFVVDFAKEKLNEAIAFFKQNQKDIGVQISNAVITTGNSQQATLGTCPICNKGNLIIKRSNKTKKRFAGCSKYSSIKCIATAPLPQKGTIKSTGKTCTECKWPLIKCIYSRPTKHRWIFCINIQCPSKGNGTNNFQGNTSKQN
jgi:DNA topoisomerase-1